jgi:hypothetical protein
VEFLCPFKKPRNLEPATFNALLSFHNVGLVELLGAPQDATADAMFSPAAMHYLYLRAMPIAWHDKFEYASKTIHNSTLVEIQDYMQCQSKKDPSPTRLLTSREPNNNITQAIGTTISDLSKAMITDFKAEAGTIIDDSNPVVVDPGTTETCPVLLQVTLVIQYCNAINGNTNNDSSKQAVVTKIQAVATIHITIYEVTFKTTTLMRPM